MKFAVSNRPDDNDIIVYSLRSGIILARFPYGFQLKEIAEALAHDYCDFVNDKYHDKSINKEWPKIDRRKRLEYHLEQARILSSDKRIVWNKHGNGVK